MTSVQLKPESHSDSVYSFFDYFKLKEQSPGVDFLRELLCSFSAIPYENISKIINLQRSPDWTAPKIRLPETIIVDHVSGNLGGTCFSLTFFLQSILRHCGFACYPVMADMRAGKNIHCCLIVVFDVRKFLVDPGYLLTEPMELNPAKRKLYCTEFSGVELRRIDQTQAYDLFTFDRHEIKWRYRFHDRPVSKQEFLRYWLDSFGRNSMNGICLTKVTRDGLLFVNRTFMRATTFDSKTNFNIKRDYHVRLQEHFGIAKELVEQAQAALAENRLRKQRLGLWVPKMSGTLK